jgi:hypothetical protein
MKRSRNQPQDSLDLLLDTMCNAFGGIILIAILIALLARQTPNSPLAAARQATSEMLERRIAAAEADLAAAQELQHRQANQPATPQAAMLDEKRSLEATLEALRGEVSALDAQTAEQAKTQALDPGSQIKDVLEAQRKLAREAADLRNAIAAQEQNSARLSQRLQELGAQIEKTQDAQVVKLRFPKERTRTKRAFHIIFKYGKVYSIIGLDGRRNDRSIRWTDKGDSEMSQPMSEFGWDPVADRATIQRLLRGIKQAEDYLALYVYPDSFAAFRSVRDAAVADGWEFGMEVQRANDELIWGSTGTTPPPL